MEEPNCPGPDNCRYVEPVKQSAISRFFAQNWLPLVIYVFTFGTMVQQNRESNAMVPQLNSRITTVEKTQGEALIVQKQTLELLRDLNNEFRAYKEEDLKTNTSLIEIAKRNREDIVSLQVKIGVR